MNNSHTEIWDGQRLQSLKMEELGVLLTSRTQTLVSDFYKLDYSVRSEHSVRTRHLIPLVEVLNAMLRVNQVGPKISEIRIVE